MTGTGVELPHFDEIPRVTEDAHERHKAALYVTGMAAKDQADARLLLDALGLLPDDAPIRKEVTS